jgi:GT2 family glycosyltransferase
MIQVSIVIPTFHRKKKLLGLLQSLSCQLTPTTEVIVIEQGEKNEKEVGQIALRGKLNLHYIYLPKASMTHARNVGAKVAKGKYLLFLDDDVIPKKGLLEQHLKHFSDRSVAATTGRVVTGGEPEDVDNRYVGRVGYFGQVSGGFSSTIAQEVDTVVGCNMCWRKDVYKKLGGVDERFTGNAIREETDLSLRAKKAGYKIIFEPKAEVTHVRADEGGARKTEGRLRWYFDFFSNQTYFFLKHRPNIVLPVFLCTKISWAIRCIFGFGREVSLRSMMTPWMGILNGIQKYVQYRREIPDQVGNDPPSLKFRRAGKSI